METHEPNVYPTILGGVSRGFWSPMLDLGARSAFFWHLKTGTFAKNARYQVPKNGTSSAQIFEGTPKTPRNTPQNGGVDSWFMRFHFRASIKPFFENHVFRAFLGPFHPLYETKISNRSLSVVYGSITLKIFSGALGTISHQWFNRGNKIQKKLFFGTP